MSIEIIHSIVLICTIAASFFFSKSNLADYSLQLVAFLFIVYFILKKALPTSIGKEMNRIFDAMLFVFIIVTIINSTGGLSSPLFFLNFFLLFALSLLLEPIISITTTLAMILFYLLSLPPNQSIQTLLPLFSLPFLTPFALFVGEEQRKITNFKSEMSEVQSKNDHDKAQTLLFLSLALKDHFKTIKDAAENFVGDREIQRIKTATQRAEKLIEDFEKEN